MTLTSTDLAYTAGIIDGEGCIFVGLRGGNTSKNCSKDLDMARSGIHIKKSRRGSLRKSTGTPAGKKIPLSTLRRLSHSKNLKTKRRAVFALNARRWKH